MKIAILLVLSISLQSSPTIVDPKEKRKENESSDELNSESIESVIDTQSLEERQILHGPIHKHKPVHYYKGDNLAFYGSCRRKFATEVLMSYATKFKSAVCSPLSALMPLAKLALGAHGRGKEELLNAIGLSRRSKIKDKYPKLIRELRRLKGVEITLGSRIFIDKRYHVRSAFRKSAEKVFGSSVVPVNFKSRKEAEDTIDSWISGRTRCKFNYKLEGNEKCVILNAITFRGKWAVSFVNGGTKIFHTPTGNVVLPMMYRRAMYNYFDSEYLEAQILEVPYESNEASFVVVLPKSKSGLPQLIKKLEYSSSALTRAIMQMDMKYIKVLLPKFSLSTQMNLKSVFRSIGLRHVFSDDSGLTKIVRDEEVVIDWAYQATKIVVNEFGTTAVSGTDSQIQVLYGSALEQNGFLADRPFLFFIKALGEQLFAGIYTGMNDAPRKGTEPR